MDPSQRKEQFSNAYLKAVSAVAGFAAAAPDVDEDSIDWTLSAKGGGSLSRRPKLDIQLKCTSRDVVHSGEVRYPLKVKNYNELRPADVMVPRILVVVVVPDDLDHWLDHSEDQLAMKHCGYWMSLRSSPETANDETVTVSIPRTNQFTPGALRDIMTRIGGGGTP